MSLGQPTENHECIKKMNEANFERNSAMRNRKYPHRTKFSSK
jgi:hypothetical protein